MITKRLLSTISLLSIFLLSTLLTGCSSSDDAPVADTDAKRTLLVYIVAANNLGQRGLDAADIAEMKEGFKSLPDNGRGYRLLVYHAPYNDDTRLFEILPDGTEKTLVTYDNSEYSVSVSRMRSVLSQTRSLAPAESYGLILWSHGTGWIANEYCLDEPNVATQSFGSDRDKKQMKITSLATVLDGQHLDFIYFDCCLMGTVEIAYQLRHATGQIVASGTELPLQGMPYDKNIPCFFSATPNLKQAALNTYNFYADHNNDVEHSCTISVIDTDALDALADATRDIMSLGLLPSATFRPVPYFRTSVVETGAYDMGHYIHSLSVPQSLLSRWESAYSAAITFTAATPFSYGLDMTEYTGLGCNIITSSSDPRLNYEYTSLQWYNDVVKYNTAIK